MVSLFLTACESVVTQTETSNRTVELGDHHVLTIQKAVQQEKEIGAITRHVYRDVRIFKYQFEIKPGAIRWQGVGSEPKHVLICKDAIYLHFIEKRSNPEYTAQAVERARLRSEGKPVPQFTVASSKIGSFHAKFVDKRYLFRLLGDSYWLDVKSEDYPQGKAGCQEYEVPNDNEFSYPFSAT